MGRRNQHLDFMDPEDQRWYREHPRFPGVAECVRLIRNGNVRGYRSEIICRELAENAADCLPELIETFRTDPNFDVRLSIIMALEQARLPESTLFLSEVLQDSNSQLVQWARRALIGLNSRASRIILWKAEHPESSAAELSDP